MKVKNVYYTFFIFIVLAILCYPIISTYAFENKKSDIYGMVRKIRGQKVTIRGQIHITDEKNAMIMVT